MSANSVSVLVFQNKKENGQTARDGIACTTDFIF